MSKYSESIAGLERAINLITTKAVPERAGELKELKDELQFIKHLEDVDTATEGEHLIKMAEWGLLDVKVKPLKK